MKYHEGERLTLYHGDNREVMRELPSDSVDSIVCDPPYELGFMGKKWDASGIAYSVEMWQEALRILKPGGHLLAFSGSRTYHRMTVAIEDAGFEIRDQIMWIYGSGFPKSKNIALSIDKGEGLPNRGRAIPTASKYQASDTEEKNKLTSNKVPPYKARTEMSKSWQGWGTALKPAHEPIVVARKPLIGTVAENVLTYGTGGLNIDGGRVGTEGGGNACAGGDACECASKNEIYGATKHPVRPEGEFGRWPANVIHDGSDEVVGLFPDSKGGAFPAKRGQAVNTSFASGQETEGGFRAMGDSGSAARFFYCAKASKKDRNEGLDGFEEKIMGRNQSSLDGGKMLTGSGNVRSNAKQNHHPTVKPTDLMRYLCRLVTPAGGVILDPFMGSGSTGKAAILEGFHFIGIEMTDEYLPIAKARIEWATAQADDDLFGGAV